MGSIFRPEYKDRHGTDQRGMADPVLFSRPEDAGIDRDGRPCRSKGYTQAKRGRCYQRTDYKKHGTESAIFELAALVEKDHELNNYRFAADIELRHRHHINPFFGKTKATRINESDLEDYSLQRRRENASNATINRELVTIKRAYNLGIQKKIVSGRPHITILAEDNVRQGFLEREQYDSLRKHLPDYVQPVADFAYITGWRKSEILSLQWRQVDFEAGNVRLEAGTTKNRDSLLPPILERSWKARGKNGRIGEGWQDMPMVFNRKGKPIGEFKHSWATAYTVAGLTGRLMHDFRRTAGRNIVRAGIPERVAMKMTGHKTRSVFERYNISEGDLRDAAARLDLFSDKDTANITKARKLMIAK